MAFDGSKFARVSSHGNNNIPHVWAYRTTDSLATVITDAYFDSKALDLTAGDQIVAHVATNPSGTLASSAMASGAASTTVTVTAPLHGLHTGDLVTFASATTFDDIPAAELNTEQTITVVDADTFTFEVDTAATSGTTGGGTPTWTSVGGGTMHILQVDGKTLDANGVPSNVQTKVLGGGTDSGAGGGAVWLTGTMTDVSTNTSRVWLAAPFAGYIRRFKTILHGAIGTADAAVGIELGGTNVTGGQITIATASSAAGDVDETTCTALNVVTAGQAVEIDTDGASTNTVAVTCMVEFVPFSA